MEGVNILSASGQPEKKAESEDWVRFPCSFKREQDDYIRDLAHANRVSRAEMVRIIVDEHKSRQSNNS